MALLDEVKVALRVTSPMYDNEVGMLISAAMADMSRVGVPEVILTGDADMDPLAKMAVVLYCKAHFGFDNPQAELFQDSYRHVVTDMLNSPSTYGGSHAVE